MLAHVKLLLFINLNDRKSQTVSAVMFPGNRRFLSRFLSIHAVNEAAEMNYRSWLFSCVSWDIFFLLNTDSLSG